MVRPLLQVLAPETYRNPVVWLIHRVWLFVRPVKRAFELQVVGRVGRDEVDGAGEAVARYVDDRVSLVIDELCSDPWARSRHRSRTAAGPPTGP